MRHPDRLLGFFACLIAAASSASAQIVSTELSGHIGYTFSEGVSFSNGVGVGGQTFNGIEPADAISYGASIGFIGYRYGEIGFLWDRQDSKLVAHGLGSDRDISDMTIDNYHGYLGANYARTPNQVAVPFMFIGFGATSYGGIDVGGTHHDGESKFSTTWGAGVKVYPQSRSIGLRLEARWTPTYIHTNPGGVWCDPYWGCSSYGDAEYSHAFELSGGILLKMPLKK